MSLSRTPEAHTRRAIRWVPPFLIAFMVLVFVLVSPLLSPAQGSVLTQKQAELREASAQLSKLQNSLDELAVKYNNAEVRLAALDDAISEIENDIARSEKDHGIAQAQLARRLVDLYKDGNSATPDYLKVLFSDTDLGSILERFSLLSKVADDDQELFDEIKVHMKKSEERQATLTEKKQAQSAQVKELQALQAEMNDQMNASAKEYRRLKNQVAALKEAERKAAEAAAKARAAAAAAAAAAKKKSTSGGSSRGGAVQSGSFVFPVSGPHSFTNTWGAPRSGGRTHKGTDIMAPHGTPVVACVSGTILRTNPSNSGLGGITIWLRGKNGSSYYYAHLSGIASGIHSGVSVGAGQTIGWVGATGNANGLNHLHFEIHPGGGGAINPYATLRAAD